MKVHSVECQLAQAQMNLYLAGDTMAEETVAELEKHIAGCEACRQALRAKKQSLQSMLKAVGAPNPVAPTVRQELRIEVPAEEEVPLDAVPAALRPKGTPDVTKAAPSRNWKPIYYSGALALVLAAMSFIGDPTRLFGSKTAPTPKATKEQADKKPAATAEASKADAAVAAASEAPDDPLEEVDALPMSEGSERPVARYAVSVAKGGETAKTPPAKPVAPKPAAKPITPKAATKPKAKPKPRPVRSSRPKSPPKKARGPIPSGMRVYDEHGKPIKP
jgi:hypothetical protein